MKIARLSAFRLYPLNHVLNVELCCSNAYYFLVQWRVLIRVIICSQDLCWLYAILSSSCQGRVMRPWTAMSLRFDELWTRWKLRIKEPTRDYLYVKITGTWWPPWLYIIILVRPLHRGGYCGVRSSILDTLGCSWSFVGVRSTRPRPVCDTYRARLDLTKQSPSSVRDFQVLSSQSSAR